MIAVVLARPFTVEVSELPVDVSEFEVALVMALAKLVVAVTPFTVLLRTTPAVDRVFELMILVELATPFTDVLMVLAALDTPLDEMILEVAITPLVFRVRVLPLTLADRELMKLVKALVTPLITVANELVVVLRALVLMILLVAETPLVLLVSTFPVEDRVFEVTADEVASIPFTVLEIVLPLVESVLVVLDAMALAKLVVAVTPLTFDDSTTPETDSAFELMIEVDEATPLTVEVIVLALEDTPFDEMTEDVAVTPLIVVVRVLPDRDWVNELMMLAREEVMPLTIVERVLPVEVATFELMILVLALEPPTFEVSVFPVTTTEFGTDRLVTERLVAVALFAVTLLSAEVPVALRFPVLVVPKLAIEEKRFVKVPVTACSTDPIRLVSDIDSTVVVPFSFTLLSSLILVVAVTPLTVLVNIFVDVAKETLFELTVVVVATLPLTVDVIMFPDDVSVFVVDVETIPPIFVQTGAPEEFTVKTCPTSPAASSEALLLALPTKRAFCDSGSVGKFVKIAFENVELEIVEFDIESPEPPKTGELIIVVPPPPPKTIPPTPGIPWGPAGPWGPASPFGPCVPVIY